jgi:radical SAM-linked protein
MTDTKFVFRIRYTKKGDLRFISHLDLLRVWERAMRRAELPIAVSQGFNPRPRLSFPLALEVGVTGLDEVMTVRLTRWIHPEHVGRRLTSVLPEGIEIKDVRTVSNRDPSAVAYTGYRVPLKDGHPLTVEAVDQLMQREQIICTRTRKSREVRKDIRPFLRALHYEDNVLEMLFDLTDRGTARPEEVMEALSCRRGRDYDLNQIVRTRVALVSPN